MSVEWSALTFSPDDEAIAELASSWSWRLKDPFVPLLFSTMGDMFFERETGGVFWLNTGTGEVTKIAESAEEFRALLVSELANEWFLPGLVEQLHNAGKIPAPGCCYSFVTLPIFANGKYTVENLNPVQAKAHFGLTGYIHQQLEKLPDGINVEFKFES